MNVLLWYFILINCITFLVWGIDKRRAVNGKRRIKNTTLLTLSALGGRVGGWVGIYYFRNKNLKAHFLIKFWAILLIEILAIYLLQNALLETAMF